MSLVYEALQKAEREKTSRTGASPVPVAPVKQPEPPRPVAATPVTRQSHLGVIVACASIVVLAAIVIFALLATRNRVEQPDHTSTAVPVAPSEPVTSTPTTPAPHSTANDPRFRITGITGNAEIGYGAFINGRFVYEKQYVDGAIVKKIERDRATLDVDGRDVVIRLY